MDQDVIFSSEHIIVIKRPDGFYIESFKQGMSVESFNKLMSAHPEIKITSFMAVKNALLFAPKPATKFGEGKERISVEVSSDELRAYVTLCVMENELFGDKKLNIIKEIVQKLNEKGVVFGIKHNMLMDNISSNSQILVAEGIPPVSGEDSAVRLYELKEAKPEIKDDGNVDHYELNLINRVKAGDWLGERHDPTDGIPGKSVMGNIISPMPGKRYPLLYDKKSVREEYDNGVTVLYSLTNGAVHYVGDMIGVSDHLEITGNVDFKTGNIDFDGYLTVKGSIEDNFSVVSDKDIEILGDYGVGGVRDIESREGSVYIKGGIAGRGRAVVRSQKDIYTKFVSDATIICEGSVHIGFYCLNSNITAKEVILDSPKGQIMGGTIKADIKVVSSTIGSASEKRTVISVRGFDRRILKERLEKVAMYAEELKSELTRAKQEVAVYGNGEKLSREQRIDFENARERFFKIRDNLRLNDEEKKALASYLRAHGEGEVAILKKAYPNTLVEIKGIKKELDKVILGTTYYVQDGLIKEL